MLWLWVSPSLGRDRTVGQNTLVKIKNWGMSVLNPTVKKADLLNYMCLKWGQGAFQRSSPSDRKGSVLPRISSMLVLSVKAHSRLRDFIRIIL